MADNTASLVVALSAQLTKFEKDMRDAGIMADKATKDIEDKFSKMNPQVNASFLGNLFSNLVTKGIEGATKALTEFYARFIDLQKQARVLDLSMQDVWGFQEAAKKGGASVDDATTSLRRLAELLAEMQRGDRNSLSRLFDANPEALKGVNRETLTLQQTWQIVADLIANTQKGVEKIEVGKLAGQTEAMSLSLDKAGKSFSDMQAAAAGSAPPLNQMAEQAKAFEGYMAKSYEWLKAMAAISLQGLAAAFSHGTAYTDEQVQMLRDKQAAGQALIPGSVGLKTAAARATGPGTQLPHPDVAAGADAYERETRAIDKQIAATQAQAATVGESAYAQEEYRVQLILTEKAVEQYGEVTAKVNDEIALQATRAAQAKQALAENQHALQQLNAAGQVLGSALSTAFADAIVEGKNLHDVVKSLITTLEKAAINSAVMSLFTAPAGGGTSIFGSLFKGLTGKQSGGPVNSGHAYLVGEHGPELMVPNASGMVVPNSVLGRSSGGALTVAPVYNIDASGADPAAIARLQAALFATNRSIESRAVAALNSHMARGA